MLILPDNTADNHPVRAHPWGKTDYEEDGDGGAYFNFVVRPELISTVLEDFKPHERRAAVQDFYALLAWVNGPDSAFETNDCALRPPVEASNMFRCSHFIGGRLEFFFRNYAKNVHEPAIRWLFGLLCMYMQVTNASFMRASIDVGLVRTMYVDPAQTQGSGFRIRLTFQAYGHSPDEAWDNLSIVFTGLLTVFRRLNAALGVPMPEFP